MGLSKSIEAYWAALVGSPSEFGVQILWVEENSNWDSQGLPTDQSHHFIKEASFSLRLSRYLMPFVRGSRPESRSRLKRSYSITSFHGCIATID